MAKIHLTKDDRDRYALARAAGLAQELNPSAVRDARYDSNRDAIELTFRGGGVMLIPRALVRGLERASAKTCAALVLAPGGDAVSWPSKDLDVYVPGLVELAFGTQLFACATGRRGGMSRSDAKAAAARANGAKGGRPRKSS